MGAAMRAQVPRRPPSCRSAAREGCVLLCACEECAPPHECMAFASPCTARTLPYELCAAPRGYRLFSDISCALPYLGAVRDPPLPQRSISFLPSAVCTGAAACGQTAALRRFSSLISRYMILSPCSAAPVTVPSDVPPKRISGSCAAVCLRTFLSFITPSPPRFLRVYRRAAVYRYNI